MTLPVLCKEDVSVALRKLEGEAALHTQRRIHVLETHQPPWAPKVVYVGALGLRGGGNVGSALKKMGRAMWGWASFLVTAIIYACKDKIPPLPCRVTTLPKYDEFDLSDSQVDNSCKTAGERVTFHERSGYWYASTSKGDIPVKSNRSASLSLEDLVNSRFSFHKVREKSF
jgi:hypothetical protein